MLKREAQENPFDQILPHGCTIYETRMGGLFLTLRVSFVIVFAMLWRKIYARTILKKRKL